MAEDTKIGAYICAGCDIGATIDIEALKKHGEDELNLPVCKIHPHLCNA